MINKSKILTVMALALLVFASCHKDLDRFPANDVTSAQVCKDVTGYKQVIAKVY